MDVYVRSGRGLYDNQFAVLPDDLKNKYIGFGVGLTDEQYELIKSNRKLLKRYIDVTIEKIKNSNEQNTHVDFQPSEVEIFSNHPELVKELSDVNVINFLDSAKNTDEMAKFIINNKNELTDGDVYYLIHYATNKYEIAQALGSENINKLNSDAVFTLLRNVENKNEMAEALGSENINKLSGNSVRDLLNYAQYDGATNTDEMANILGSENINKLTRTNVFDLLYEAENKDEIAKALGSENINKLDADDVRILLMHAPSYEKMANILGSENLSKLSDDNIHDLLKINGYSRDEIAKIIINYKKELTDKNLSDLIDYAADEDEIKKLLREKGFNVD